MFNIIKHKKLERGIPTLGLSNNVYSILLSVYNTLIY